MSSRFLYLRWLAGKARCSRGPVGARAAKQAACRQARRQVSGTRSTPHLYASGSGLGAHVSLGKYPPHYLTSETKSLRPLSGDYSSEKNNKLYLACSKKK